MPRTPPGPNSAMAARAVSLVLDDIDKLREPAKQLAAWRRLITDTVQSVTVAPAMTADGHPSRLWDPDRIDVSFLGQQLARDPVERSLDPRAVTSRQRQPR
ncbi:MAG: hypothetical protein WBP81_05845 [Solirubrobacteraceae bacterium]